jgi:hypothetical protein
VKSLETTVYTKISVSVNQLVELFWSMDENEQAEFFNKLGEVEGLPLQLQAVTDSEMLRFSGRWAMDTIGQYAEKSQVPSQVPEVHGRPQ